MPGATVSQGFLFLQHNRDGKQPKRRRETFFQGITRWLIRLGVNHTFPSILKGIKLVSQGTVLIIQYVLYSPVTGRVAIFICSMSKIYRTEHCVL